MGSIGKGDQCQTTQNETRQNMDVVHTVYPKKYAHGFALLCFVVVIHWLIFPYPSGLLHWHCGNLTIAQVPAKQPWCIWINTSCEFIMNNCITTTKQSTTKPCAYFLGYTVVIPMHCTSAETTATATNNTVSTFQKSILITYRLRQLLHLVMSLVMYFFPKCNYRTNRCGFYSKTRVDR